AARHGAPLPGARPEAPVAPAPSKPERTPLLTRAKQAIAAAHAPAPAAAAAAQPITERAEIHEVPRVEAPLRDISVAPERSARPEPQQPYEVAAQPAPRVEPAPIQSLLERAGQDSARMR